MKNYILSNMFAEYPGLYLCELPTGYGKTYTVVHAMHDYIVTGEKKRIIYLTTMNKNLPEQELLAAFGGDKKKYDRYVLRIRSNFDEVTEKLPNIAVPEMFKTKSYDDLISYVSRYNRAIKEIGSDRYYISELQQKVTDAERVFRNEIRNILSSAFHNKSEKKKAIAKDAMWKWVGELYPAVFTDDHQILLMSISKFMKRNSTLIEPSYEFIKSELVKGAVIIIDEFDATKESVQSELIDRALAVREEYIDLFKVLLNSLNPDYLSGTIKRAYQMVDANGNTKWTFDRITHEAKEIAERYFVRLSYKTAENNVSYRKNFLLKDTTYHTAFHNKKDFIRAAVDQEENRVYIFFESASDFYSQRKDSDIVIFSLLREINRFIIHFKVFLYSWAKEYMELVNLAKSPDDDAMTMEAAMSSIMERLELSLNQQRILTGELCSTSVQVANKEVLPDNSFYQLGMEIFELQDSYFHNDRTKFHYIELDDTPEKILGYLCTVSNVFGISATAEVPSVVGNYDLYYLQSKLKENFHKTPSDIKRRITKELDETWQAYNDGRIRIHSKVMANNSNCGDWNEKLEELLGNTELADICITLIQNTISGGYHVDRYCNLIAVMQDFLKNQSIQSFLYLSKALPKSNNPEFDIALIEQLFDTVKRYTYANTREPALQKPLVII